MAKWSRLASSLTVGALVACSSLIVLTLNSSTLVSPQVPASGNGNGPAAPLDGLLRVMLRTNQQGGNSLAAPGGPLYPVAGKAIALVDAENVTAPAQLLFTDATGSAEARLSPGQYLVEVDEQTLHMSIPVTIADGNETRLNIAVLGAQYPVNYTEISGTGSSAAAGENTIFLKVRSPSPIAKLNDTVVLKVTAGASEEAANATVVAAQQYDGFSWLRVETPSAVNATTASGMAVEVYDGYYSVTSRAFGFFFR
jgi:hypothetical protein